MFGEGFGEGKWIVLVSGDDEYCLEEVFFMFGKFFVECYGFYCMVFFLINFEDGIIKFDF